MAMASIFYIVSDNTHACDFDSIDAVISHVAFLMGDIETTLVGSAIMTAIDRKGRWEHRGITVEECVDDPELNDQ